MLTARNSLEMLLMALTMLFIPMYVKDPGVRFVMKVYGLLFAVLALLLIAGYIIEVAQFQPGVHISTNPLARLFSIALKTDKEMLYAVFVMAGVMLKLGFGRHSD